MRSFGQLTAIMMMLALAFSRAQTIMGENECQWPLAKFRDLFVIACDAYNCEEKVTNCTKALIPKANVCELKEACKRQTLESSNLPVIGNTRMLSTPQDFTSDGQMSECVIQKLSEKLNIEYFPGDGLMNVVKYLNTTFGPDSSFDEEMKLSMLEAVVEDICIVPEKDDDMEILKFNFCLLKVCVDNMPDVEDYEYDENAETEDEVTDESVRGK